MEEFEKLEILDFYSPVDYYNLLHISRNYNEHELDNEMKLLMKYQNHNDIIVQLFGLLKSHKQDVIRIIYWIGNNHPTIFRKHLPKFVAYIDDWDITLQLVFDLKELPRCFLLYFIKKIFLQDLFSFNKKNKETMSRLCLSLPRERSCQDKHTGFVSVFCNELNLSRKEYRKYVVGMKQILYRTSQ